MDVAKFGVWLAVAMAFGHYLNASESDAKLDLNAVGAFMEFGLQSPLHHESYYGFAIDGDLDTNWTKCAISNFGEQTDFLIDLRGIYPVDRIAVLSRRMYAAGAEVFVGNSSSANKYQIQCGGKHPKIATASFTEFSCSATVWIQYIRIRKFDPGHGWNSGSLQICEVAAYHDNQKYDVGKMNVQLQFELFGSFLKAGSSYEMATDGKLDKCVQSIEWTGGETVFLKIDLKRFYFVTKVLVIRPKPQSSIVYVSNTLDFLMMTRCHQNGNHFHCSGSHQVRYITIVGESPNRERIKVCEVEVFHKQNPRLPCRYLPHLPNSTAVTDWKTATYTYIDNRAPETQIITCQNGHWSPILEQCKPKKCPDLIHPIHAVQPAIKCMENNKRQCQLADDEKSLKWSGSEPTCKVVHCGDVKSVDNATVTVTSNVCGGTASYKCKKRLTRFGSSHLFCGPEGKWLGTVPVCVSVPGK